MFDSAQHANTLSRRHSHIHTDLKRHTHAHRHTDTRIEDMHSHRKYSNNDSMKHSIKFWMNSHYRFPNWISMAFRNDEFLFFCFVLLRKCWKQWTKPWLLFALIIHGSVIRVLDGAKNVSFAIQPLSKHDTKTCKRIIVKSPKKQKEREKNGGNQHVTTRCELNNRFDICWLEWMLLLKWTNR